MRCYWKGHCQPVQSLTASLTGLPHRGGAGDGVRRHPSVAQRPFLVTAFLLPRVGRDKEQPRSRHRRNPEGPGFLREGEALRPANATGEAAAEGNCPGGGGG